MEWMANVGSASECQSLRYRHLPSAISHLSFPISHPPSPISHLPSIMTLSHPIPFHPNPIPTLIRPVTSLGTRVSITPLDHSLLHYTQLQLLHQHHHHHHLPPATHVRHHPFTSHTSRFDLHTVSTRTPRTHARTRTHTDPHRSTQSRVLVEDGMDGKRRVSLAQLR